MYCNVAWGHTFRTHLSKLQVLQKKVIRLISSSHFRHPSTPLFLQLRLLPLDQLVSFNCLVFMFKLFSSPQPCLLKDLFVMNSDVHHYNTRHKDSVHQPYVRTCVGMNSFHIYCIKQWNLLPADIKCKATLSSFKVSCKKYLYQNLASQL